MNFVRTFTFAVLLALPALSVANTDPEQPVGDTASQASASKEAAPLTLYNFKLEADEELVHPQNMTVEKGKEFIPDLPVAEQLYLSYVNQGAKPLEAITYTYVELRKAMSDLQASE